MGKIFPYSAIQFQIIQQKTISAIIKNSWPRNLYKYIGTGEERCKASQYYKNGKTVWYLFQKRSRCRQHEAMSKHSENKKEQRKKNIVRVAILFLSICKWLFGRAASYKKWSYLFFKLVFLFFTKQKMKIHRKQTYWASLQRSKVRQSLQESDTWL